MWGQFVSDQHYQQQVGIYSTLTFTMNVKSVKAGEYTAPPAQGPIMREIWGTTPEHRTFLCKRKKETSSFTKKTASLSLCTDSARIHKQERTACFIYWETNIWRERLDANRPKIILFLLFCFFLSPYNWFHTPCNDCKGRWNVQPPQMLQRQKLHWAWSGKKCTYLKFEHIGTLSLRGRSKLY